MRYKIHVSWTGSGELRAADYNTFAEVLSYIQTVCDINCDTAGLAVKIVDTEKKNDIYNGPLNEIILAGLRYNYEKGLI